MNSEHKTKFGLVKNPLTVIAVFAGLAEVTATIALPQLASEVQVIFVWFVMLFPTLLVVLFFTVLWKKHHILYAPSDFDDEKNFMRHWIPAPPDDDSRNESSESDSIDEMVQDSTEQQRQAEVRPQSDFFAWRKRQATAVRLVIESLSKKLGLSFATEVALSREIGTRYDAVASTASGPVLVEVKHVRSRASVLMHLRRELERVASLTYKLPENELQNARVILVFVFETSEQLEESDQLRSHMRDIRNAAGLPLTVELEFYSMDQLEQGEIQ